MMLKAYVAILARVHEERGAVASEYAVLLALIAVALVGAVGALSGAIAGALNAAAGVINGN
ncbi:MAG: Flp family type IVb pilin [Acidimicrobiales bacterium]